jgi:hypothetical protein
LLGRGVGRAIGGEKGEELGGLIGDIGDLAVGIAAERPTRSPSLSTSAAGESAYHSSPPPRNIAETQPDLPGAPPAAKGPVIADTNVIRSLDDAAREVKLNDQDRLVVKEMEGYDVKAAHNAAFEASERGGTLRPFEVAGPPKATTRAEREAIMHDLQEAGVGSTKDQLIVRQALLNAEPLTFVTGDDSVINGLARLAGINPARLDGAQNVTDYLQKRGATTFSVTVRDHVLTVKPLQKVR